MSNNDQDMKLLGDLICRLNPYTEMPPAPGGKTCTGDMRVTTDPTPDPQSGVTQGDRRKAFDATIDGIAVEVEENYGTKWSFKGQTQSVKTAVRIPYRFPVYRPDKDGKPTGAPLYWQTEYLLIGYAGSDGA